MANPLRLSIGAFFNHDRRIDTKKEKTRAEIVALTDQISAQIAHWATEQHLEMLPIRDQVYRLYGALEQIKAEQAAERSEALLIQHLDKKQQQRWQRRREILVKGQTMTYRVSPTETFVHAGPNKDTYLCVAPSVSLPHADRVLATKLMIEGAEEEFLSIANPNSNYRHHLKPDGSRDAASYPDGGQLIPDALFPYLGQRAPEPINQARARAGLAPLEVTAFGDTQRTFITNWQYTPMTTTNATVTNTITDTTGTVAGTVTYTEE